MQLKFEKFRENWPLKSAGGTDKYRAVLVGTQHNDGDRADRIEIAELEKREVMGGAHRCDWAIKWLHPALGRNAKFSYEDMFDEAKRTVEDAVMMFLRGALASS